VETSPNQKKRAPTRERKSAKLTYLKKYVSSANDPSHGAKSGNDPGMKSHVAVRVAIVREEVMDL